jgi:hypothetical protein
MSSSSIVAGVATPEPLSTHKLARLAGLLYIATLPTAGFGIMGAHGLLDGGVGTAAARIAESQAALQVGVLLGAIGAVIWLALGVVFYALFRSTSERVSQLLLVCVVASATLLLAALAGRLDAIALVQDSKSLTASSPEHLQALVVLAWRSSENLMRASIVFWGLWLLPLGWLAIRSRLVPRTLGILLMLGAPYYLAFYVGLIFQPGYEKTLFAQVLGFVFLLPGSIGELGAGLWLLVKGKP